MTDVYKRQMLRWEVFETPGWRIDWCEDGSSRVVMEDSAGGKVWDACSHFRSNVRKKVLLASPGGWLPAPGTQWISCLLYTSGMIPMTE